MHKILQLFKFSAISCFFLSLLLSLMQRGAPRKEEAQHMGVNACESEEMAVRQCGFFPTQTNINQIENKKDVIRTDVIWIRCVHKFYIFYQDL